MNDVIVKWGQREKEEPRTAGSAEVEQRYLPATKPLPHKHRCLVSRFQFQSAKATSQSPPLVSASGD